MQHSHRLLCDIPQPADFSRFYAVHADPQTNLFNPAGPMNLPKAEEAFHQLLLHWKEHNFGSWTIKLNNSSTIIGFGGLSYRMYGSELKLNLGYRFDAAFWGQGFATELAHYALHYGFDALEKDEIFAIVRPQHSASIKVLEKCGLQICGALDDVPNAAHSLIYSIKKEIYSANR